MTTGIAEKPKAMPGVPSWLGGLGLVPFVAGAVLANIPQTADVGLWLIVSYGAVILSFLGGIQWGVALTRENGLSPAFILSNVISLAAWCALLLPPYLALMVLGAGFVAALCIDFVLIALLRLPGWFLGLRAVLTVGVLAAIAVAGLPLVP